MSVANLEAPPINFVFPLRDLESERVKLTIFDPALHTEEFFEKIKNHPDLFKYLPYGPFNSVTEFLEEFYNIRIGSEPKSILYAVFDKTREVHRLAGVVGLLNTETVNQCTEIGFITILPEFQRTHVSSNAIGLLLHYCLELPSNLVKENNNSTVQQKYGQGLGLRRVQWQAHAENERSARAAERMGFRREGIIRWQRILGEGKEGSKLSKERVSLCKNPGRHTYMASLCWDDWELEGTREFVRKQMDRL